MHWLLVAMEMFPVEVAGCFAPNIFPATRSSILLTTCAVVTRNKFYIWISRSLYTLYTHSVRVKVVIEISLFGFIFWYIRFLMPEYAWICGNSCIMIFFFFFHIRILSVLHRLGLLYCPNWKCMAHSSPHFPLWVTDSWLHYRGNVKSDSLHLHSEDMKCECEGCQFRPEK